MSTMKARDLIENIRNYCLENADEGRVLQSQRYFKHPIDVYGLSSPQVYEKVKELLKTEGVNLSLTWEAMPSLVASGKYEEVSFGLLLVDGFARQFTRGTFEQISRLFPVSIHNWAHADMLGMFILPKFLDKKIIEMNDFRSWLDSPYKFQRRCVPVTLIKHIKKTKEVLPSIRFVEKLMTDPEREVHQGVGWFLREAWKIDPEPTEQFLLKWKDTAPRLIFQYACEKMSAESKLRFRKVK
jgi:3-methyladenine DNA glycosylase AlkD